MSYLYVFLFFCCILYIYIYYIHIFFHLWGSIQRFANLMLMELGSKIMKNHLWKKYCFCVVGCGTRSLSRRVPCPLLKVVLEAKTQQKKMFVFFWPIFSILGYLSAFCCLFVAKLPLTFAKLNSIPLSRARGPLNDEKVHIKTQLNHAPLKRYHWIILDPWGSSGIAIGTSAVSCSLKRYTSSTWPWSVIDSNHLHHMCLKHHDSLPDALAYHFPMISP